MKGTAAAVGGAAVVGALWREGFGDPFKQPSGHGMGDLAEVYTPDEVIHTMCMQCNTFCTIKVRITPTEGGEATSLVRKIAGNPYSPLTTQPVGPIPYDTSPEDAVKGIGDMKRNARSRSGGIACLKGQAGVQIAHDAARIKKPMKRVGERGSGKWQTISWEEALSMVLDGDSELGVPGIRSWYRFAPKKKVMEDWDKVAAGEMTQEEFDATWGEALIDSKRPELGPKSNLMAMLGGDRMALLGDRMFHNSFGSINHFNHGGTCGVTGVVANARMHPDTGYKRMYMDIDYCNYLVVWGTEPLTAQKGPTWLAPRIGKARARGMTMVVVDPRMSKTAEKADVWVPVLPGKDIHLAFGILHWMLDKGRYDEKYLRSAGTKAAEAIGEPTWTDATYLVKVDDEKRGKFSVVDMGQPAPEPGPDGKPVDPEPMVLIGDTLTPASEASEPAELEVDREVQTPNGPVRVKSVFTLLKERVFAKSLDEHAKEAGVPVEQIEQIAHGLTSHGKRAGIMSYRGPAMHSNGFDTIRAIGYINFLLGNHDWKGGHITAQRGFKPRAGRYDLDTVPEARKAWGVPITREKTKYETTSFFKQDGYPAKRRWYPFPGNLCHEVLPSAAIGYPYSLNALFMHRHSPLNSSPGAHRQAEILQDTNAIKLLVAFDIAMGDSAAYADLLLPDTTYLERFTQESIYPSQQYAVTQFGQPVTRAFDGPRAVEWFYLELAKAMELPGVGKNAFGEGAHFETVEDYYMKMAANIAYAGKKPVADAPAEELELFTATRKKALGDSFDEDVWRAGVTAEEWPKVVTVLNRGGRFEEHGDDHANGYEGEWLKSRYEGLCQFYDPKVAGTKDAISGEFFDGLPVVREHTRSDGSVPPGKDLPFHFVNWKARQQGTHRTINSTWLREVRSTNYLTINPRDAEPRGIKSGDKVRITSASGEAEGIAYVTEGIRPGIVGADAAFGHKQYGAADYEVDGQVVKKTPAYGHTASARYINAGHEEHGFATDRSTGIAVNILLDDEAGGGGICDPIGGGAAQLDSRVDVVKA
ncbi:molybdopterin dinucleotide-binding protein [Bowdeniella nasicola]|uniref:Molybdopterin dinucleotide-binding protein n=1 Tax=Bowdeniella nasicola TaxID=208480 RepID=A0A1Q5Q3P4_9ACTO|nr:molybdopterin dinucleotide-binding protein [Bowdeniella nasicola]